MEDLVEVYIFTQSKNAIFSEDISRLLIGCVAFVVGIFLFRQAKKDEEAKGIFKAIFVLFWAVVWSSIHGALLISQLNDYSDIVNIYNNGSYSIAEGKVKVIHEEPAGGHDKGDVILVDGTEFEFSYYRHFFYYHQTISHGGVLKEGVYARLTYVKNPSTLVTNPIIRVEILETE